MLRQYLARNFFFVVANEGEVLEEGTRAPVDDNDDDDMRARREKEKRGKMQNNEHAKVMEKNVVVLPIKKSGEIQSAKSMKTRASRSNLVPKLLEIQKVEGRSICILLFLLSCCFRGDG